MTSNECECSISEVIANTSNDDALIRVNSGSFTVGSHSKKDGNTTNENGMSHSGSKAAFTVSGINFSVRKSQTLAIVGPVGSGKSVS